ncbi:MFS general substrate transporter [Sistotremastrum suecicum HHB10207 ss-3]|uniref:MFS general substrate transporter n=1 Tax=Sistotremastrum suecicum HHB10207 ss-3 TaxID=1314776 RepID=A0A165ZFE7_9AGAM|nr:MFS general substrate transporter [Sistotremastrum suecicum HHB10207 ss-3]
MSLTSTTETTRTDSGLPESINQTVEIDSEKNGVASSSRGDGDSGADWRGWSTVFSAWCVQFVTGGHVNAFGVYEAFYKEVYLSNESTFTISWIGSVPIVCLVGFGVLAGAMFDRGYYRHVLIGASALYIFSNFMLSITQAHHWYQVFLSQGVGMGLAMGAISVPSLASVCHHFPHHHRSLALGVASSGAAFGGFIYPIMLNDLINLDRSLEGEGEGDVGTPETFRRGVRISAGVGAGLLVIANVLVRERKGSEKRVWTHTRIVPILKDWKFFLLCCGTAIVYFGSVFPSVYIQLFAASKGLPPKFSFFTLPIFNAASALGRIILNFLADRFGCLKVLIVATIGMGATLFGFIGIGSVAEMSLGSLFLGFFVGGFNASCVAAAAGWSVRRTEIGTRIGILSFFLRGYSARPFNTESV